MKSLPTIAVLALWLAFCGTWIYTATLPSDRHDFATPARPLNFSEFFESMGAMLAWIEDRSDAETLSKADAMAEKAVVSLPWKIRDDADQLYRDMHLHAGMILASRFGDVPNLDATRVPEYRKRLESLRNKARDAY